MDGTVLAGSMIAGVSNALARSDRGGMSIDQTDTDIIIPPGGFWSGRVRAVRPCGWSISKVARLWISCVTAPKIRPSAIMQATR